MRVDVSGEYEHRRPYPVLFVDPNTQAVYLAPNCYTMVDLRTGYTVNQRSGLEIFTGRIVLTNLPALIKCDSGESVRMTRTRLKEISMAKAATKKPARRAAAAKTAKKTTKRKAAKK